MRNTQTGLHNLHLTSNLRKLFSHLTGSMVNRVLSVQYESFNDLGREVGMVDSHGPAGLGPGHLGHHVLQLVISSVLDHQRKTAAEAIRLLDTSLNLHIQQTKTAVTNLDFYIKLNADFLMELGLLSKMGQKIILERCWKRYLLNKRSWWLFGLKAAAEPIN